MQTFKDPALLWAAEQLDLPLPRSSSNESTYRGDHEVIKNMSADRVGRGGGAGYESESRKKVKRNLPIFLGVVVVVMGEGVRKRQKVRGRKEYLPLCRVKRQQKVSNIHTQSKHQTSSNTRERDTLISLPPQEAGIFRKSSKCKLIYYRKRTRGAGVQPNSRLQRVKAQTVSFSPQRLVSFSRLGAVPPTPRCTPPTNSHTNRHDRILH